MATESGNRIWLWVGLAFGLMLAAWVAFFMIASRHPVETVPLQNASGESR